MHHLRVWQLFHDKHGALVAELRCWDWCLISLTNSSIVVKNHEWHYKWTKSLYRGGQIGIALAKLAGEFLVRSANWISRKLFDWHGTCAIRMTDLHDSASDTDVGTWANARTVLAPAILVYIVVQPIETDNVEVYSVRVSISKLQKTFRPKLVSFVALAFQKPLRVNKTIVLCLLFVQIMLTEVTATRNLLASMAISIRQKELLVLLVSFISLESSTFWWQLHKVHCKSQLWPKRARRITYLDCLLFKANNQTRDSLPFLNQ